MAQDTNRFSWSDYDDENAHMTINTVEVTAANLDAQQTLITALRSAMNALTLTPVEQSVLSDIGWDTTVVTTDPYAQREIKWTIIVRDTAGNEYKGNEVPCAKLAILESNDKYIIKAGNVTITDATNAPLVEAFKDAYEAVAVSNTGLALTIWAMYQSGRNN